ncbi:MAG: PilZ domain-containing protein [Candidatus Aminicenantes bacterium]|jgi:hypothetical protein|nr:PilZ domain-containing protein [Candidatus Aminicenantes bacterium]
MSDKGVERRLCHRFKIPGSTVAYTKQKFLLSPKGFDEEFCPVLDISRGGVRFLTQKPLKFKAKVVLQISIPGERVPLNLKGCIRWSSFNPGKSYKFQAGVQFNAYGEKKDQNYPGSLVKIIALEQKFIEPGEAESSGNKSEFSI